MLIFYLFLVFQNVISLCSIGCFYAAYSIFLREAFHSTRCSNIFEVANILENLYILSLLLLLFLSTSADAKYLNIEFWIFSFIFSIFSLLLIGCSIYYAFGSTISLITILLFGLYVSTYMFPLIFNCRGFRISTLIGGLICGYILSPVYILVFPIYSISNIHNVQWGSRGENKTDNFATLIYKSFRFKFLLYYILTNTAVAIGLNYLKRSGQIYYLFVITIAFSLFTFFKICFSVLSFLLNFCSCLHRLSRSKPLELWADIRLDLHQDLHQDLRQDRQEEEKFELIYNRNDNGIIAKKMAELKKKEEREGIKKLPGNETKHSDRNESAIAKNKRGKIPKNRIYTESQLNQRYFTTRNENSERQNESEGSEEVLNRQEEREETKDGSRRFEANSSNFATLPTVRDRNKNIKRNEMMEDKKELNNMVQKEETDEKDESDNTGMNSTKLKLLINQTNSKGNKNYKTHRENSESSL